MPNAIPTTNRQLIMCSPTGTLAAGGSTTLTTTISEPGVYHTSRLVASVAAGDTALGTPDTYLADDLNISSLSLNGSSEFVRGRNSPVAPLGAFSAYRGLNNLPLPDFQVDSGDTVAITIGNEAANTGTLDISMACAFSPSRIRGGQAEPLVGPWSPVGGGNYCTYVGSAILQLAAGDSDKTITMTFDSDGIVSLQSLQARAVCDLTGTPALTDWWDGLSFLEIGSVVLPGGDNIVVGQNTSVVNGAFFASGRRNFTWANLGAVKVTGGSTITFQGVENKGPDTVNASFGMRFWPSKGRC